MEDLQLHEASHKYLELVGWKKLHGEEVEQRTSDADRARTELVSRDVELEAARQDAFAVEEEVEHAQTRAFSAENEVRAEEAAIARAKDRLEALKAREVQAENESKEIEAQRGTLERERATFETELHELERDEELKRAQAEADEARLGEATSELSAAEARRNEANQSASSAQAAIASAEATLAGHDRRAAEMTTRLDKVKLEREALDGALVEHQGKLRGLESRVEAIHLGKVASAEERERAEKRLAELRTAIVASEKALEEARAELSGVRSRHQALTEIHSRLEGVGAGPRTLVEMGDDCILGLVGDRIEAPQELTHALAGLLGERLTDVVVTDMERGVAFLEEMAQSGGGRAAIVPARPAYIAAKSPTMPEHEGIVCRLADSLRFAPEDEALVRSLVGDAIVVRDAEAAQQVCGLVQNATVVTLAGTVHFADGRVVGGSGDEVAAGRLDEKRELRELGEKMSVLDTAWTERLTAHQALRGEIAETQATLEAARTQAHADELALVNAERDLRSTTEAIGVVEKRLTTLGNEAEELARWIDEGRVERQNAEAILDGERARLQAAQTALEAAHLDCATHREQVDARRALVTEAKVRLAGVNEKLTGVRGTIARLDRSATELGERGRRLIEDGYETARQWGETAAHIALHKEKLQTALDEMRSAQNALSEARARYEAIKSDLSEREAKLKDLRTEAETLRDLLGEAERALHTRTMALEHLLESASPRSSAGSSCRASWAISTCARRRTTSTARASTSSPVSSNAWAR